MEQKGAETATEHLSWDSCDFGTSSRMFLVSTEIWQTSRFFASWLNSFQAYLVDIYLDASNQGGSSH